MCGLVDGAVCEEVVLWVMLHVVLLCGGFFVMLLCFYVWFYAVLLVFFGFIGCDNSRHTTIPSHAIT